MKHKRSFRFWFCRRDKDSKLGYPCLAKEPRVCLLTNPLTGIKLTLSLKSPARRLYSWSILALTLLFTCNISFAAPRQELTIFGWAGYVPPDVIKQFTQATGIHVRYAYFDSDEMMYARLKTDAHSGYDLITPSTYYVDRMRKEGMLYPIDLKQLTNLHNLNPMLMNKSYDPGNHYSIPYTWGSTGVVVNDRYYNAKSFKSFKDLWNPKYKGQVLLISDVREVFGMAFLVLGYPFNDTNPEHIKQAYEKLRQLMPNVKIIADDEVVKNTYIDEDVNLGMSYSGDAYLAHQGNHHVKFYYPSEGFGVWVDCLAIPKYAPHAENAIKFMNFVMQPKIAAEISEGIGYSTPNLEAVKLLPPALQKSVVFNPSNKILARGQSENDIGSANLLYEHYWQLLQIM